MGGLPPGGGRGGPPPRDLRGGLPDATAIADPLKTFFEDLRALREVIVIRDEQAEAWIALREALREYATAKPAGPPASGLAPERAIALMADEARRRADTLERVSHGLGAVRAALDDHQRNLFDARLTSAFAQP